MQKKIDYFGLLELILATVLPVYLERMRCGVWAMGACMEFSWKRGRGVTCPVPTNHPNNFGARNLKFSRGWVFSDFRFSKWGSNLVQPQPSYEVCPLLDSGVHKVQARVVWYLYCQRKKYARVCQRVQVENSVPFSGHQKDLLTYTCRQSERSLVFSLLRFRDGLHFLPMLSSWSPDVHNVRPLFHTISPKPPRIMRLNTSAALALGVLI